MTSRELAKLSSHYLTDGKRGIDRPSLHNVTRSAITARMRTLFLDGPPPKATPAAEVRRLIPIHRSPNIYLVPHFLSPRDLDHMDELLTSRRAAFKHSHTDADESKYQGEERTSISLALPKAADATLRAIEARAAELVGLPADHVEPLQIVHYSEGARFDMHHDVAPIKLPNDEDEDDGKSSSGAGAGAGAGVSGDGDEELLRNLTADDVKVEQQAGPRRLVTLFVYLNSLPEGVGHTEFPLLRDAEGKPLSVRPRSGTALVFCNVDEDGVPDVRLCHRACPGSGDHRKFGVNIWISDVTQQMHAIAAPPSGANAARGRSAASQSKGLLAPLLYAVPEDTPPPPPAALLGLRMRKAFGPHGTFVGELIGYSASLGYHVEYEDGDEEDLGVDEVLAMPLADAASLVGRRVAKHFPGHGKFEGEVVRCDDAALMTYRIVYEDGDEESDLPLAEVLRLLLPPKSKAKAGKRKRVNT